MQENDDLTTDAKQEAEPCAIVKQKLDDRKNKYEKDKKDLDINHEEDKKDLDINHEEGRKNLWIEYKKDIIKIKFDYDKSEIKSKIKENRKKAKKTMIIGCKFSGQKLLDEMNNIKKKFKEECSKKIASLEEIYNKDMADLEKRYEKEISNIDVKTSETTKDISDNKQIAICGEYLPKSPDMCDQSTQAQYIDDRAVIENIVKDRWDFECNEGVLRHLGITSDLLKTKNKFKIFDAILNKLDDNGRSLDLNVGVVINHCAGQIESIGLDEFLKECTKEGDYFAIVNSCAARLHPRPVEHFLRLANKLEESRSHYEIICVLRHYIINGYPPESLRKMLTDKKSRPQHTEDDLAFLDNVCSSGADKSALPTDDANKAVKDGALSKTLAKSQEEVVKTQISKRIMLFSIYSAAKEGKDDTLKSSLDIALNNGFDLKEEAYRLLCKAKFDTTTKIILNALKTSEVVICAALWQRTHIKGLQSPNVVKAILKYTSVNQMIYLEKVVELKSYPNLEDMVQIIIKEITAEGQRLTTEGQKLAIEQRLEIGQQDLTTHYQVSELPDSLQDVKVSPVEVNNSRRH